MKAKSLDDISRQMRRMLEFNRNNQRFLSRNYADRIIEAAGRSRWARGMTVFDKDRTKKKS